MTIEDRKFRLQADYQPAGDQPAAIAGLIEGLENGLSHQTLLGVTGSGKSIGYDDQVYIVEHIEGRSRASLVRAGPFIDQLMSEHGAAPVEPRSGRSLSVGGVVPRRGLEPPRPLSHWYLKPARLPIPPPGQVSWKRQI